MVLVSILIGVRFSVDASLNRVGWYTSPYVPPITRFRFMDLPVELRVMVARYALTADQPLEFRWITYTATKKIGGFEYIDRLTALTRVSKAVRKETADVVWMLNTYKFGMQTRDTFINYDHHIEFSDLKQVLEIFIRFGERKSLAKINIWLEWYIFDWRIFEQLTKVDQMIRSLSIRQPKATWRLYDIGWHLDSEFVIPDTIQRFKENAKSRLEALAKLDATNSSRAWKLFPEVYCGNPEFSAELQAAGLLEAGDWVEHGL